MQQIVLLSLIGLVMGKSLYQYVKDVEMGLKKELKHVMTQTQIQMMDAAQPVNRNLDSTALV